MGQAKAKRDKAREIEAMGFPEQCQHFASKVVKEAKFLIDNGVTRWMQMEADDGTKFICIVFPTSMWELVGDELKLKRAKNESDKTTETT